MDSFTLLEGVLALVAFLGMLHHLRSLQDLIPSCIGQRSYTDQILCRIYLRMHRVRLGVKSCALLAALWMLYTPTPVFDEIWETLSSAFFRVILILLVAALDWEAYQAVQDREALSVAVSSQPYPEDSA